ncbi:uncharacterized protein LOC112892517 [Panicum hallii]|nr:uncharacterized protein LOC112892517 [Panicum hallii]
MTMSPSAALAALGSALFLLSSAAAARRALGRGDARAAASVAAATALVAALLAAVRAHDRARGRRRRGLLRAAAWALSAALTAMFARRVAALAPGPAAAALVWALAGATVAGGFCCLFVHGRGGDGDPDHVGGGRDARPA